MAATATTRAPATATVRPRLPRPSLINALNLVVAALFLAPWVWATAVALLPSNLLYTTPPTVFHWPPDVSSIGEVLAFDDGRYLRAMQLSAVVAGTSSALVVLLGCPAGYAFARLRFRGKGLLFLAALATMMFPFTSILVPLFSIMSALDLVNNPLSLIILYTVFHLPFAIYLFRTAFESIPGSLRDAALIDGCREVGVLWRVMLPLVLPAVATVVIYSLYHAWNEFTAALIFLTNDQSTTLPVVLSYMAQSSRYSTRYDLQMTGSIISFLPILALYVVFQRFFVRGLTAGASKG